jgi:hypothetical protein
MTMLMIALNDIARQIFDGFADLFPCPADFVTLLSQALDKGEQQFSIGTGNHVLACSNERSIQQASKPADERGRIRSIPVRC